MAARRHAVGGRERPAVDGAPGARAGDHGLYRHVAAAAAGGARAFAPRAIVPINDLIRGMAAAEGAVLVDLYPAFEGHVDTLLGADGLHPNEAGYQKMAETFFAAVRGRLEAISPALPTLSRR